MQKKGRLFRCKSQMLTHFKMDVLLACVRNVQKEEENGNFLSFP